MSKFAVIVISVCIIGGIFFGFYKLESKRYAIPHDCCLNAIELKVVAATRDLPAGTSISKSDVKLLSVRTCQLGRGYYFTNAKQVIGTKVRDRAIRRGAIFKTARRGTHQRYTTVNINHRHAAPATELEP